MIGHLALALVVVLAALAIVTYAIDRHWLTQREFGWMVVGISAASALNIADLGNDAAGAALIGAAAVVLCVLLVLGRPPQP